MFFEGKVIVRDIMPYIFAIVAGIFTTIEASINSHLGKLVTPKIATLHSLVIGALVIFSVTLARGSIKDYIKVLKVSPYWLIGGIFGAGIIYLVTKTIPKLGITMTLTLVVASQILSALFIDVFVLKYENLNMIKIIGSIMVLLGVYLIVD